MIKALFEHFTPIFMGEDCNQPTDPNDVRKDPKKPKGTYAAYRLDSQTEEDLDGFLETCGLRDLRDSEGKIKTGKRHVTIMYSRKVHDDYEPNKNLQHIASCKGYAMYGNALVMLLDCPSLEHRHHELHQKHGATYDFPTYNPHVSLHYGMMPVGFTVHTLPLFGGQIILSGEYKEDLIDD
jgi:hypothetical protein